MNTVKVSIDQEEYIIERLTRFYFSEYVKKNQPWLLQTSFSDWLNRQLARISMEGGEQNETWEHTYR